MRPTSPRTELHIALIGEDGVGKSEETYCHQETIQSVSTMIWLMDTVEKEGRDDLRWLTWADLYLVMYDITSAKSFQYAERLLEKISKHEHVLCSREHRTLLVGNKTDLERYRVISESDGRRLAAAHGAIFAESSAAGDPRTTQHVINSALTQILSSNRSPSPTRLCSSDSEIVGHTRKSGFSVSFRSSSRALKAGSSGADASASSSKLALLQKSPSMTKINKTGSKLRKLFHN